MNDFPQSRSAVSKSNRPVRARWTGKWSGEQQTFILDQIDLPLFRNHSWSIHKGNHLRLCVDTGVFIHSLIAGAKPGQIVSFRDGNPLNLRRENLVIGTRRFLENRSVLVEGTHALVSVNNAAKDICTVRLDIEDAPTFFAEKCRIIKLRIGRSPGWRLVVKTNDGLMLAPRLLGINRSQEYHHINSDPLDLRKSNLKLGPGIFPPNPVGIRVRKIVNGRAACACSFRHNRDKNYPGWAGAFTWTVGLSATKPRKVRGFGVGRWGVAGALLKALEARVENILSAGLAIPVELQSAVDKAKAILRKGQPRPNLRNPKAVRRAANRVFREVTRLETNQTAVWRNSAPGVRLVSKRTPDSSGHQIVRRLVMTSFQYEGKRTFKQFDMDRLGGAKAVLRAIEWRVEMIRAHGYLPPAALLQSLRRAERLADSQRGRNGINLFEELYGGNAEYRNAKVVAQEVCHWAHPYEEAA